MPRSPSLTSSRVLGESVKGFDSIGGKAVFTSECNPWAQKTYAANYGDENQLIGDIVGFPTDEIPDHDVLLAGFPCQPFSIAGVSKKNSLGRPYRSGWIKLRTVGRNRDHRTTIRIECC